MNNRCHSAARTSSECADSFEIQPTVQPRNQNATYVQRGLRVARQASAVGAMSRLPLAGCDGRVRRELDQIFRCCSFVPLASRAMTNNEKPQVDVPVGQPPSYQLELEDIAVGEGPEAT